MKFKNSVAYMFFCTLLLGCIGKDFIDDFVDAQIRIENPLLSLGLNESHKFEATYLNNIGQSENVAIVWSSSDETVVSINPATGLATALKSGEAVITATTATPSAVTSSNTVQVTDDTVVESRSKVGSIASTSSYKLTGDFVLEPDSSGTLELSLSENYEASTSLPGLYVYLSNNPNSVSGAYEIGKVTVFKGAHSYTLPENITITDYNYVLYWCKPFSVKVGGGSLN